MKITSRPIEKVICSPAGATERRRPLQSGGAWSEFFSGPHSRALRAVSFEEDGRDPNIWFLNHNYHESMFSMFRRINVKKHVVGWYSTGAKLKENDLNIHELFNGSWPNSRPRTMSCRILTLCHLSFPCLFDFFTIIL
ncbi:RP non-ATPase subunit 8A, partial [Striga asiatica]